MLYAVCVSPNILRVHKNDLPTTHTHSVWLAMAEVDSSLFFFVFGRFAIESVTEKIWKECFIAAAIERVTLLSPFPSFFIAANFSTPSNDGFHYNTVGLVCALHEVYIIY